MCLLVTTTGVTLGLTITGTSTVICFPFGNSITTGTTGLTPGVSVPGLSPIETIFPPSGILTFFSTSLH